MRSFDTIVIGAGAAGLMCALTAGQRGKKVLVLERAKQAGQKILISGGGRCNFTHQLAEPEHYLSQNHHFSRSALARYPPEAFIAMVERHGIAYHEKAAGQLFCDGSSRQILGMLLEESALAGVEILDGCEPREVVHENGFRLETDRGTFCAPSLVVASGGLSLPALGGSDLGYRLAEQFGMKVLPRRAGLVPLTLTGEWKEMSSRLSGTSVRVRLSLPGGKVSFLDHLLFTHRGLSGPAVLQISSYWREGESIRIDLFPDADAGELLREARQTHPRSLLRTVLQAGLARRLLTELEPRWWPELAGTALAELSDQALLGVAKKLHHWLLTPAGTEGYRTAEITLGGVDTDQLSSKTMESKVQSGLYFIGEVVDVSGQLGGFNLQWAWSSGFVAGSSV